MRERAQRIYEKAEHVQRDKQRRRQYKAYHNAYYAKPAQRIIYHAAYKIEHHAHRARNKAKREYSHIGENIAQVPRYVIKRAQAFAKAKYGVLYRPAGEQQQHAAAKGYEYERYRLYRGRGKEQYKPRQKQHPAKLIEYGALRVAIAEAHIHFHDYARVHMHYAQPAGKQHHLHNVRHGIEQQGEYGGIEQIVPFNAEERAYKRRAQHS